MKRSSESSSPKAVAGLDFCGQVYDLIENLHSDQECLRNGSSNASQYDFVRYVPCEGGRVCSLPQSSSSEPLDGSQFTFKIDNQQEPT